MATCDQLDDYLCGWLNPTDAAGFDGHLEDCEACRSAMELQQRIDRNLTAYSESIPIPDDLISQSTRQPDTQRSPVSRRNRVSGSTPAAVLAAAVVLLFIVFAVFQAGVLQDEPPERDGPIAGESPASNPPVSVEMEDPAPDDVAVPIVTLQPGADTIAVPIPSSSNRVSVFRVYNVMGNPAD